MKPRWMLRFGLVLAAALVVAGPGCKRKSDDGTAPEAAEALPELVIRDDTPNLLLTWIDARGAGHTEVHARDVPEAGRALVRVVAADRVEGTGDRVYVVDLTKAGPGGGYTARTITRRAWEAEFEKRREAYAQQNGPAPAPPPESTAPAGPKPAPPPDDRPLPSNVTVIVYGATWCGPCHEAERWLKARGVPVVMKDIEKMPGAEAEMQQKLEKSGRRGGSIPVIDVAGQILVGYSSSSLERAIRKAAGGTVL